VDGLAETVHGGCTSGCTSPDEDDLRLVIECWPDLSRPLKDAVLALCRTARSDEDGREIPRSEQAQERLRERRRKLDAPQAEDRDLKTG
jgi:hypothetical protein